MNECLRVLPRLTSVIPLLDNPFRLKNVAELTICFKCQVMNRAERTPEAVVTRLWSSLVTECSSYCCFFCLYQLRDVEGDRKQYAKRHVYNPACSKGRESACCMPTILARMIMQGCFREQTSSNNVSSFAPDAPDLASEWDWTEPKCPGCSNHATWAPRQWRASRLSLVRLISVISGVRSSAHFFVTAWYSNGFNHSTVRAWNPKRSFSVLGPKIRNSGVVCWSHLSFWWI